MEKKLKILIVEDDKNAAETTKDILNGRGYECDLAENGEAALNKIKDSSIDVILSDIKMPVMNGVEMCRNVKKNMPALPVIMMTAFRDENLIKDALKEGAYGVLYKPLDFERVINLIERCQEGGAFIEIVDDDSNFCEVLNDILSDKGYVVTSASTGEEAVKIAEERPQDIIFLDYKLPRINGLEVFSRIKNINPNVVVIMITAYYNEVENELTDTEREGIYAILKKPVDVEQIVLIIDEVVKSRGES